jgi:hypothetical protein
MGAIRNVVLKLNYRHSRSLTARIAKKNLDRYAVNDGSVDILDALGTLVEIAITTDLALGVVIPIVGSIFSLKTL